MVLENSQPRSPHSSQACPGRQAWGLKRGLWLAGTLALWILALTARLYQLEVVEYADLLSRAQRQQQRTIQIAPQRGTIYDSQLRPLAMSLAVDSVFAVPAEMSNRQTAAGRLARVLGLNPDDLLARFNTFHSFCWVKRKVTSPEADGVRALGLQGIYFQKEMKRFYPKGSLAAQAIGYVGLDDKGLAGLEYGLDREIRGEPGRVLVDADAHRQAFHSTERPGQPGRNIILTLDENIQYIAEKALAEAMLKWHAPGGAVVVQNPATGEILALASEPNFDPNRYVESSPNAWLNRAVGWVYEPGSTFKLVAVSAAIEEKVASPQEIIDCQNGSIVLANHVIHDHKPFGELTVEQVLVHSSDVGAIKLGLRLGPERLYRYIRGFGFGSPTDFESPGQERGLLKPPERWSGISLGEISMGQEVGVTALQLAGAYSAIANGGVLFQPHIVRDIFLGDRHRLVPPAKGRRVVSRETAKTLREMLEKAVEEGTGVPARLAGYTAAGKTGTAQKIDASGAYSHSHYVASFVGFAPAQKPAVTILVVIDSPVGAIYGGEVAAPVFRSIAEQTLGYLNVPQDNPSWWPQIASSAAAGFPRQKRGDRADNLPPDSEPTGAATSTVQPVTYRYSKLHDSRNTVLVDDGPQIRVPDFSGLAMRRVAEECQNLGFDLQVLGSGLAVLQDPPAGAQLPAGSRVRVQFAR